MTSDGKTYLLQMKIKHPGQHSFPDVFQIESRKKEISLYSFINKILFFE